MMEKPASYGFKATQATVASFLGVRAQGTVIVKRLEDLAKEGDSPVDSFPWFDPSQ